MQKRCFVCMEPTNNEATCPHCGFDGNLPEAIGDLKAGTLLKDRYYIGKVFSQHPSSTVYIGYDEQLNTKVFVRRFTGEKLRGGTSLSGEELVQRFLSYSKNLAAISLCNILPRTIDIFKLDSAGYSVTEFFDGQSLKDLLNSGIRISGGNSLKITEQLLNGIKIMHNSRMMFGAISPESLYILKNGDIKLFGLGSPFYDFIEDIDIKVEFLNPSYAAPELFEDTVKKGSFCDVYSIAAILYRMLTDTIPPISFLRSGGDTLTGVRKKNKNISKSTKIALLNALNWPIERRTQTTDGFLKELSLEKVKRKRSFAIIWADILGICQKLLDRFSQKIKEKRGKKSKIEKPKKLLWLWITIPAVLLVFIVVLSIALPHSKNNEDTSSVSAESEDVWYYGSGIETANPNSNGYFYGGYSSSDKTGSNKKPQTSDYGFNVNDSNYNSRNENANSKNTSIENASSQNVSSENTSSKHLNSENVSSKNASNKNSGIAEATPSHEQTTSNTSSETNKNKVECPDLIGYTLSYAKNALEKSELKLGKITYKESPDYLPDYVMEQSVSVGTLINKGSTVDIVVCKATVTSEEKVNLPDVVGDDIFTATATVKAAGFNNIEYEFIASDIPAGTVTNISTDSTATHSSTVTITVSGKRAVVYDYYGKTISETKAISPNIVFEIKTQDNSPFPEDAYGEYRVISQSVSANTVGYEGMTVTVTVEPNN